jgi:putative nucleotidyltransferase with HDIG domain
MAENKKTKKPAATRRPAIKPATTEAQLAECRKQLDIMGLELDIYREIGGMVVKGATLTEILGPIMDFALKAVETRSGTLYLVDPETEELIFSVVKGPGARKLTGQRLAPGKGIAGLVATTGRPHVSEDLKQDSSWLGTRVRAAATDAGNNMIAIPLLLKERVIGVIQLINKTGGRHFTTDDLKVLSSLANHFSIIMERGGLFSELDEKLNQFSALHDVGNLLISTLDREVIHHRAMTAITGLMHAEAGSLLLVDNDAGELYFEVALGKKGSEIKEVRLRIGEGIAGWVAKYGRPLIIPDVTTDRRFNAEIDKKSRFRTRNIICVPVKIKGRVIGVLEAINRIGGGAFTKAELKLFQLFSNQVAIALDNARLYEEIRETFHATSEALAEAIEKRDPYTGGHTKRVLEYCMAIARELGLSPDEMEIIKLSAVLHDIGKIGVEDRILRKEAPLDESEAEEMKMHPQFGAEILKHIPQLKEIVPGMLYHHERVDGLGYPEGLKDGMIPLVARIISVADTFDAMTTTRPYRDGLPTEVAFDELKRFANIQFDTTVVEAFLKAFHSGGIENLAALDSAAIKPSG